MNLDTVVGRRGRAAQPPADPRHHQRKCGICNHKDRQAIDADFLLWRSAQEIVHQYAIPHRCYLYRHADATGLSARRREHFRTALDSIIEQAESAPVTGNTIIRAIRAYSCLTQDGRCVDPPTRVIVERPSPSESSSTSVEAQASGPQNLIETPGLENASTH
ncbi:MAG: hypothetical protein ACRD59_14545 [Candidatus Acidiferrales bacterium]